MSENTDFKTTAGNSDDTKTDKPHYSAYQVMMHNKMTRMLPHLGGSATGSHLQNTKHSKAWADYGYPYWLTFAMYHDVYKRVGLARAVVDRKVDVCWMRPPTITVGEENHEENAAEKTLAALIKRIRLWRWMKRADTMQRVGRYSALIWRIRDNMPPSQELGTINADQIAGIIPAWEGQLLPADLDTDPYSDRYGLPTTYTYSESSKGSNDPREVRTFTVHHTRVTILAEGSNGNSIYGESAIEPCFNGLIDWEKIRGAGGEGFWRQAALRHMAKSATSAKPDKQLIDALNETYQDMLAGLDEMPFLGGMDLVPLGGELSNPEHFKNTALEDVAAGCGLPAKSLIGSQTGVLAGDEDGNQVRQICQSRCETELNYFVEDVLEWMMQHGALDRKEWVINWDDLTAPSRKEKIENSEKMYKMSSDPLRRPVFTDTEIRTEAGHDPVPQDTQGEEDINEPLFKEPTGPDTSDDPEEEEESEDETE